MKLVTTRDGRNYLVPFLLVTSLFFLWGFAHSILDVLNKFFQNEMHLTKTQSAFIQVVVYGGYFLMALPAGAVIRRWGYRAGVFTGLFLYGIGALLFIPGAEIMAFPFFLFSLFVIGCGLTFLETSANPYVTVLGDAEASEQRINFSQSFNGLGWILGPLAGGWFLFSQENSPNIALPYAIIGLVVLLIGGVFCFVRLPEIKDTVSPEEVSGHQDDPRDENRDLSTTTVESSSTLSEIRILSRKSAFVYGWVALFVYVAAQTGVNSFFINYATEHIAITDSMAATLLSFGGMGLFMLGRLGGSWAMGRIRAERLLAILAIIATLATSAVVLAPGGLGFAALLVVYLCESIMFPTIFALALRGLGAHTKIASSLLIMSIVGGAVAPLLMGIVADGHSMALGFVVPLVCFVVIAAYAVTRR